jgi:hypothetical protein
MSGRPTTDASNHLFLRYSWNADDRVATEQRFAHVLETNPWFTVLCMVATKPCRQSATSAVVVQTPSMPREPAHTPTRDNPTRLIVRLSDVLGLGVPSSAPR